MNLDNCIYKSSDEKSMLRIKEDLCSQQMDLTIFILHSGYTGGEARGSWTITNPGGMTTGRPCAAFQVFLPITATTHWFSFSNTRQEPGMLFISIPPHQGNEWVLLILSV